MALPKITFRSTTSNGAAPLTCGHAFVQGDIPSGSTLAGVQCTPKTTWPDGSVKFAVLAASQAITGGTPLDIQLSLGTAPSGTAISTTTLKATGITASIGCGAFGTASWATTDWDTPFLTWVSGPIMSSFIYRKPVGSDSHLVAWLRVNCFANGAVDVLPWIENGYLFVAGPTNKVATYTFSLGGTQRFSMSIDAKHHQRTPLINGTALSYWLATDPGISVSHDKSYMQLTEMVPTYAQQRSATGLATLPSTWSPFDKGGIIYRDNRDGPDVMKNPGYQWPIGLLGEHDAAYLFCNDQPELLYGAVVRNGFVAGRYPIHYRDESTNRAPSLTAYPNLTVTNDAVSGLGAGGQTTPTPTGGVTTIWDGAHHPSCGYMAHLVTGDFYHLETVQLINAGNFYSMNSINNRAGGQRCRFIPDYESVQTRQAAWGMRTLAQALAVTPNSDPVQPSLIANVTALVNYYHATFVAQPNNQFGFIEPGESGYGQVLYGDSYTGGMMQASWQDDFFTASYGYALAMGLPLGTTTLGKLSTFFAWKARCVIGRLGPANGFRFECCDPYVIQTSTNSSTTLPDYQGGTGPWPTDWKAIFDYTSAAELGRGQTWISPVVSNTISGEFDISTWPKAMLGNLMPAISYAKRFGVPGADAAYARLLGASNWSAIQTSFVNNAPLWYIAPSSQTTQVVAQVPPSPCIRLGQLRADSITIDKYYGNGVPKSAIGIADAGQPKSPAETHSLGMAADTELLTVLGAATNGNPVLYEDQSIAWPTIANGVQSLPFTLYINGVPDTGVVQANVNVIAGDTSPPVMQGSLAFSAISPTGYVVNWQAATDNIAVTGYELSTNGGTSYINVGNVLSYTVSGAAASTTYPIRVRPYDAVTNRGNPLIGSVTTNQATSFATTVTFAVVDQLGNPVTASGLDYAFYDQQRISAGFAPIKAGSNLSIVNGVATISIAGLTTLTPGGTGRIEWGDAGGTKHGGGPVTVI